MIMYMDKQLQFSEEQTLATGVSENIIDRKAKGDAYEQNFLVVTLDRPLGAGMTLQVDVESAKDEAFTTPKILATFQGVEGKQQPIKERFPRGAERFVRLKYTTTATGKITADLVLDVDTP